jgi:hypothetical protein
MGKLSGLWMTASAPKAMGKMIVAILSVVAQGER